jgi:hypothetical protein
MKLQYSRRSRVFFLAAFWAAGMMLSCVPAGAEQDEIPLSQRDHDEPRLPNGRSQRDAILKAEHQQNVKDAGRLVELSEQLRHEIEKNDRYVLSISALKKTDEIEKLVKKIRSRLRHD